MKEINGQPMIFWQIKRILNAKKIDKLIIATSVDSTDDTLANYLLGKDLIVYRGSLNNVLSRFIEVSGMYHHDALVRLTADCPLVMPELLDTMITEFYKQDIDYMSNTFPPTFPDGLDIEIVRNGVLEKLNTFSLDASEIEHVTKGIYSRPQLFKLSNFRNTHDSSHERWTVDYQSDFDFVCKIFHEFRKRESEFTLNELRNFLANENEISSQNYGIMTKESSKTRVNEG